jgi:hypothetical protein
VNANITSIPNRFGLHFLCLPWSPHGPKQLRINKYVHRGEFLKVLLNMWDVKYSSLIDHRNGG